MAKSIIDTTVLELLEHAEKADGALGVNKFTAKDADGNVVMVIALCAGDAAAQFEADLDKYMADGEGEVSEGPNLGVGND
jgi:hypothetical protein